jgi:small ubiquitin-related modifier
VEEVQPKGNMDRNENNLDNEPTFKVYLSTELLPSAEEVKFQTVKTHFMKMSSKNCHWSITSIEFVTNVDLQKKFHNKKAEFKMKNLPDEEIFAYHGTQPKNVKNICKTNLNIILRTAHGGGYYFTEYPEFSLGYGAGLIMFKLLPGLSYVGSSHNHHTGKNAKFQSKEVQGPKTGQLFNMRIIENNEQFMPHCILHLTKNSVPGTAHAKRKKSTKSYPGVLPVTGLQKAQGSNQNHLTGQGNDRNEDMTFAQHLAQALRLSREDNEMTEILKQKEEEELQSAIKESLKNQNQSFVMKNAETEPIITVRVVGQDSNGLNFRVKMSTNMGKLKKSYAERVGVPLSLLKFLFNGHHISDDESPEALKMMQDDIIEVYEEQTEGAAKESEKTECIKLKVIGQDSNEIHFLVKMSTNMGKLKKSYAEKVGVPVSSLKFLFDGRRINDNESPKGQ